MRRNALGTGELARQAAAGDRGAAEALWDSHRRWIAAVLLAQGGAEDGVEDLLHEVAAAMLRGLPHLRRPEQFRPWLRRIAVNIARDAGRRAEMLARRLGGRESAASLDEIEAAERSPSAQDAVETVLDMVRSLPEPYREVLLLRCVEELSQREIAAALELPETTVETRLARARRMLRERSRLTDSGTSIPREGARPGLLDTRSMP